MTSQLQHHQERQHQEGLSNKIGFKNIQLFTDQLLGIGAYGKVCKARCNNLDCAAKILHSTLFTPNERQRQAAPRREHRLPMSRFEQECELMSAIRHPNIVQYLGITQDPNINLPVILMELMDGSLTHFLESSPQPIPYHITVNICHDVTLALSFLHSNNIVHRDLSSNNVLLFGDGVRAKVTDFGMASLADLSSTRPSHFSFTLCPGTEAYMPPEAMQDKPEYTEKLDSFSFGVLTIQTLTRQFPKPGERRQLVDMSLPDVPRGRLVISVPEIERRQNHISLIKKDHPLLSVSLDCLDENSTKRPTANELCQRISDLKKGVKYSESVSSLQERDALELKKKDDEMKCIRQEHTRELERLQQTIGSNEALLEEANRRVDEKEREITKKEDVIIKQSLLIYQKEQTISRNKDEHDAEIEAKEMEIRDLKSHLQSATEQAIQHVRHLEEHHQILAQDKEKLKRKDSTIRSKEADIQKLSQQLEQMKVQVRKEEHAKEVKHNELAISEDLLATFQKRIGELEKQLKVKDAQLSLLPQQEPVQLPSCCQASTLPLRGEPNYSGHIENSRIKHHWQQPVTTTVSSSGAAAIGSRIAMPQHPTMLSLKWRKGEKAAPKMMSRGPDPIVEGDLVFFTTSMTVGGAPIFCYNTASKAWFQVLNYPYCMNGVSLAIVRGQLTGIGGNGDNGYTNKLFSFQAGVQKWSEIFPPMPSTRANASVLVIGNKLIVIGGKNETTSLKTTDVMDIDTRQWYTSRLELPEAVKEASITIHEDRVYMLGGSGDRKRAVYTCPIRDLTLPKSTPFAGGSRPAGAVLKWSRIANLPADYSSCVSFHGNLLAIGGEDSGNNSTTAIHAYDPSTNTWKLTNHMLTGRSRCFAVVLPDGQLMVVGGWTKRVLILFPVATDQIEFGSVAA